MSGILLVDDVEVNRFLLEEALAELGVEIRSAATGEEALALWRRHAPEVALVDLQMPGFDGAAVAREVKADASAPFTYVMIISGFDKAEQVEAVRASGADRFLAKPYGIADLRSAVEEGLRIARERRR
ncbi:MAG: response regulator [Candidatus Binatia bacterium]